jgi:hypothetical protein
MAKDKRSKEIPQMRKERLALSKCMTTQVVLDKRKFNKKRERQKKFLPSFLPYFGSLPYLIL